MMESPSVNSSCNESGKSLSPPSSLSEPLESNIDPGGFPIGWALRIVLIVWSLFLIAGFAMAVYLRPDPKGFGTHQQLGLPECTFRTMFHIPCPSCGMTTCFSNYVRGRFWASARANVAGLYLALLSTAMIPWSWISVYQGRLWKIRRPEFAVLWLLLSIIVLTLTQWGIRLALG